MSCITLEADASNGHQKNWQVVISWRKLVTAIEDAAEVYYSSRRERLARLYSMVNATTKKLPVKNIVICAIPFLCYLLLFKNYAPLRQLTGLDQITKPSITFLPWLESTIFHCMPHKILASVHNPVLDFLAAIPYLIHFILPVVFPAYLVLTRRSRDIFHFLWCLGWVNFVVVLFQFFFPTAPPWYTDTVTVDAMGHLNEATLGAPEAGFQRVDTMIGFPLFNGIYSRSPLKFGAFPSLHVAWPTVVAACGPIISNRVGVIHVCWITWAALYSNHHYLVDAIMGILIVLAVTKLASRGLSPFVPSQQRTVTVNAREVSMNSMV